MTETAIASADAGASNDAFAAMFSGPNGASVDPSAPPPAQAPAPQESQAQPSNPLDNVPMLTPPVPGQQPNGQENKAPPPGHVPVSALQQERRDRQEAEKREAALVAQLENLSQSLAKQTEFQQREFQARMQAQQPRPQPQPLPDPAVDPEGFARFMVGQQQRAILNLEANFSERLARKDHGDETVNAATKWAVENGINGRYIGQPDPYAALVQDYNAYQVQQTYGRDPTSVERAVMAKFGIDYDALKARQSAPAQPAAYQAPAAVSPSVPRTPIPPSLAQAGPGSLNEPPAPDGAMHFNAIMGAHKNRPR